MCGELVAKLLWEAGAVKVNLKEPFRLVSGNCSPVYIDCRKLISDPHSMRIITTLFCDVIEQNKIRVDVVAGGESAGIPFASFLAKELGKPLVYVRKKNKSYGTEPLVEGNPGKSCWIILVEDLITDGLSKLGFIESLKSTGNKVEHCL